MRDIKEKKRTSAIIFLSVLTLYFALIIPRLINEDMFLDGITYASLARNMSESCGSFWQPCYTESTHREFYENPPLGIWLQSLAFRIFKDSNLIEFFWGVITGLIILLLTGKLWSEIFTDDRILSEIKWFPVLIFILIPKSIWVLSNNMLESTMTVFVLLSSIFILKALKSINFKKTTLYSSLSGVMLVCAFLTKGFPGLFPLSIPLINLGLNYKIRDKIRKNTHTFTATVFFMFLFLSVIILISGEQSVNFIKTYLHQQVFASLSGTREVSGSRLLIIKRLTSELLVPLSILIISALCTKQNPLKNFRLKVKNKTFILFLLTALSGTLPLCLSPKQMSWYFFPVLPFFSVSLALFFKKAGVVIHDFINKKISNIKKIPEINIIILISILTISLLFRGKILTRQPEMYRDLVQSRLHIKERSVISFTSKAISKDWYLIAVLQRYYKASLKYNADTDLEISYKTDFEKNRARERVQKHEPEKYMIYRKK